MLITSDHTNELLTKSCNTWLPAPGLRLSQWADEKFYLSPESAAEPEKWKTYSYQCGPMDAITDLRNHKVTWKKSARVGYTKIINCAIAYHIEHDPCSQLVVLPTIEDGKGYSRDEIEPMIRDTLCINGLVADAKSRNSGVNDRLNGATDCRRNGATRKCPKWHFGTVSKLAFFTSFLGFAFFCSLTFCKWFYRAG